MKIGKIEQLTESNDHLEYHPPKGMEEVLRKVATKLYRYDAMKMEHQLLIDLARRVVENLGDPPLDYEGTKICCDGRHDGKNCDYALLVEILEKYRIAGK